jgi:hypothetical protein
MRPINAADPSGSAASEAAHESTNEMVTAANEASVLQEYDLTTRCNGEIPSNFAVTYPRTPARSAVLILDRYSPTIGPKIVSSGIAELRSGQSPPETAATYFRQHITHAVTETDLGFFATWAAVNVR